jgi:hypothetical protein
MGKYHSFDVKPLLIGLGVFAPIRVDLWVIPKLYIDSDPATPNLSVLPNRKQKYSAHNLCAGIANCIISSVA